jgi:hypothetical protein
VAVPFDGAGSCDDLRTIEDSERSLADVPTADDPTPSGMPDSRVARSTSRCAVADDNIQSLEDAIIVAPPTPPAPYAGHQAGPPEYLDLVERRFVLEPKERALLKSNGFVVPARLERPNYGAAFHDIFQSELPIFVTSDAILHAIFAGNDKVLSRIESGVLEPLLRRAVAQMTCALPAALADYPHETAEDLDTYLGVANALFGYPSGPKPTLLSDGTAILTIANAVGEGHGLLGAPEGAPFVLFGRARVVDASAYQPRGHYTGTLSKYFQAVTWLSRLELNLSSRGSVSSHPGMAPDPRETPREELLALAMADLADRSGALSLLAKADRTWSLLAGRREDISLTDLVALRKKAGIGSLKDPGVAEKLRAAIGDGWKRTARTHFTPQGTKELPAIATMLGARIGPDTAPTKELVTDTIPSRFMVHATEMAYVLGNNRAKTWLAKDIEQFPTLARQLDVARAKASAAMGGADLYSLWLKSVVGLSLRPAGAVPSFMATSAWADLRLDTTLTAFGQVRHNYILMAAGTYDSFGCQIPDGYVEPAPAMLDGLIAYAERGARLLAEMDPRDASAAGAYFRRVEKVMRTLRRIVSTELAGAPLSLPEKRFLGMVAEFAQDYRCFDSCAPPTYTGWWYDLFIDRIADGTGTPAFIADYYASTNTGEVAYIGAKAPRLGIFLVDTNGKQRARAMVGPVAHGYEYVGPLDSRTDDEAAHEIKDLLEPWAASYTVPAPPEPRLRVSEVDVQRRGGLAMEPAPRTGDVVLMAASERALGNVQIELLDHHRQPIATLTHWLGTSPVRYRFPTATIRGGPIEVAGLRVRALGTSFSNLTDLSLELGRPEGR